MSIQLSGITETAVFEQLIFFITIIESSAIVNYLHRLRILKEVKIVTHACSATHLNDTEAISTCSYP